VDNQIQVPPNDPNVENIIKEKEKEISKESTKKDDQVVVDNQAKSFVPKASFPQHLQSNKKRNHYERILKVFKNVQINIPFLDAINQILSYVKFLKDLTTIKRKTYIPREATFAAQASCLIQQTIALKYKDPESPTISVRIGDQVMNRCLLDLGASVNLLPYSVYNQLGLGELKLIDLTLLLADRSVKIPKRIVEDVILKVDKFYFPVDFVVLDTELITNLSSHSFVILGRSFFATVDVAIRCRNGVTPLSFGNMTVKLNVFHTAS